MSLRLATFNVENLMSRFDFSGFRNQLHEDRTLALFDHLPPAAMPSYLSGLVIGEELRCRPLEGRREVVVIGAAVLAERLSGLVRRSANG